MTKKKKAGKWIGAILWIIFGFIFVFGGIRLGHIFENGIITEHLIFLIGLFLINTEIFYLLLCFFAYVDEDEWFGTKMISLILGIFSSFVSALCYPILRFLKTVEINWVVIFSHFAIIIGIIGMIVLFFYGNYQLLIKIKKHYK